MEKQARTGRLALPPDDSWQSNSFEATFWSWLSIVPFCEDPVGRKFVLLVDCDGLGMGSLLTGSIVRDLIGVMQATGSWVLGSSGQKRAKPRRLWALSSCLVSDSPKPALGWARLRILILDSEIVGGLNWTEC